MTSGTGERHEPSETGETGEWREPIEGEAAELLHRHLGGLLENEEWVQHVEHDPAIARWYLRFGCEGRDAATIYFDLRQRSLYHELYFMPMPPPDEHGRPDPELLAWLLRRNRELYGTRFAIGSDGDVYLVGRTPLGELDETKLDHLIGEIYATTETWFQPAIALGFRRP